MTTKLLTRPTVAPMSRARAARLGGEYLLLTVGSVLLIYAFRVFMLPFGIAGGGVGGLALVANQWMGVMPGSAMLVMNVPVMVLGYLRLGGWRFLIRTAYVVALYNIGVDHLGNVFPTDLTDDLLLVSLFGGVISGLGAGLIFRAHGTAAGTSIISRILQLKTGLPVSQIYLVLDGSILILLGLTFGWDKALYGVILLFVNGLAVDYVLEGPSIIRTLTVVTDKPEMLTATVFDTMHVGVTGWQATGMYTETDRYILFCTVSRAEARRLMDAIRAADPESFTVIGHAHQRRGGLVKAGAA